MGLENLPEGSFQFFTQSTALVLTEAGAEEMTEGGVVALAENLRGKVLGAERDAVPAEEVHPFLEVEGVAIDKHAVHIEDGSRKS
jgi:hypothetical protein